MPKILYGNFDFEHELESAAYRSSARIQEMSAQLAPHLIALAEDGDSVWCRREIARSYLDAASAIGLAKLCCAGTADELVAVSSEQLECVPWGVSAAAAGFAAKRNWILDGPEVAAVRQVNDRRFAEAVQARRKSFLPGSSIISSQDGFVEAVRVASAAFQTPESELRWVIKSPFGMASRGRVLGAGRQLDDASANWLRKQIEKNSSVLFEPWVECDREFSTQWNIPRDGRPPTLRGWTEIQTEGTGAPSSWLRLADVPFQQSEFRSVLPALEGTVKDVAAAGYFGPVGIDSMRFRNSDSSTSLRPIQDINARYTMGRVALEMADRLAPDADAAWLLLSSNEVCRILDVSSAQEVSTFYLEHGLNIALPFRKAVLNTTSPNRLPDDAQVWLTSPLWLEDVLTNRCGILIASREESKLAEFFRGLNVLPGGNTAR